MYTVPAGPAANNAQQKKSRLRNMSLAAFGARMPYDEALGSLVGAKKMDRNGKVSTKTSLIRCKFLECFASYKLFLRKCFCCVNL